jgi:hypothetical protein
VALEKELDVYKAKLPELLSKAPGQHVVICGDDVLGTFETYETALTHGYEKCGLNTPFLVKRILAHEPVHFISRFIPA